MTETYPVYGLSIAVPFEMLAPGETMGDFVGRSWDGFAKFKIMPWGPLYDQGIVGFWCVHEGEDPPPWMHRIEGPTLYRAFMWKDFLVRRDCGRSDCGHPECEQCR